jgi:hypothetical protein
MADTMQRFPTATDSMERGSDWVKTSKRWYRFADDPLGTMIKIDDKASPWLADLAKRFPAEFNRAIRHVGWWLMKELKDAAAEGGPPGHKWPALSEAHKYRKFDDLKYKLARPALQHFGRLAKGIGYKHEPDQQRVRVGWLSSSLAWWGNRLQEGFDTPVTPKVRRFSWAAGVHPKKSTIRYRVPARPLFAPIFRQHRPTIQQKIEDRIFYCFYQSNHLLSATATGKGWRSS